MSRKSVSMLAEVKGSGESIELLYKNLNYLKNYTDGKDMAEHNMNYLPVIVKDYRSALKNTWFREKDASCYFDGVSEYNVDKETNMGNMVVFFNCEVLSESNGRVFWQLMCDVLDLTINVKKFRGGPRYNYTCQRERNLSDSVSWIWTESEDLPVSVEETEEVENKE